jgi:hypothetical protein
VFVAVERLEVWLSVRTGSRLAFFTLWLLQANRMQDSPPQCVQDEIMWVQGTLSQCVQDEIMWVQGTLPQCVQDGIMWVQGTLPQCVQNDIMWVQGLAHNWLYFSQVTGRHEHAHHITGCTSHMLLLFTGVCSAPHCLAVWYRSGDDTWHMTHSLILLWMPLIPMSGDRQMDWQPELVMSLIHELFGVSTVRVCFKLLFMTHSDRTAPTREWCN